MTFYQYSHGSAAKKQQQVPFNLALGGGGGVHPYKGLKRTCGQPGYVFRDFCLNQGIDLSIFVLNRINVLNRVSKIGILS